MTELHKNSRWSLAEEINSFPVAKKCFRTYTATQNLLAFLRSLHYIVPTIRQNSGKIYFCSMWVTKARKESAKRKVHNRKTNIFPLNSFLFAECWFSNLIAR